MRIKSIDEITDYKLFKKEFEQDFYGTVGTIDEAGANLSRVLKMLEGDVDFLIITASRGDKSRKENSSNNNALIKDIRDKLGKKIGAYKLVGHWKECSEELKDNEKITDCKGTVKHTIEETWLIIKPADVDVDKLETLAKENARRYNQDAYIIRKSGKLTVNGKDGTVWEDLGKASKDSISSGFSRVLSKQGYTELAKMRKHGRTNNIIFENLYVSVPKDNNSSRQLFKQSNILY